MEKYSKPMYWNEGNIGKDDNRRVNKTIGNIRSKKKDGCKNIKSTGA